MKNRLRQTLAVRPPALGIDDAGALAIVAGCLGGVGLLWVELAWWAGSGLLCALLVGWGFRAAAVGSER